jgi:uncharacterized membrane-anchored protein YitT (DUF2179 family)
VIGDFVLIGLGALLQAVALRVFLVPANLASGGVSGIAQLINYYTDWPIGMMVLFGNIPLFALGWRFLGGRRFALRTATAIVTYSIFVDLIPKLPFFQAAGLTNDILLNSLYGAVVSGVGYGLVYRANGTSGGSDVLARILNHWRNVSMTQSYMMVDSAVILAAGVIFGWQAALYALITLYVSGIVADRVMEGGSVHAAMIITNHPQAVAERIMTDMERGVTLLEGTGAFTGYSRPVLYCVVSRSEVQQLKTIVSEADAKSFMVVGTVHEALGEGFRPFKVNP